MGSLLSLLSGISVRNYIYIAIAVIMIGMATTITIQNLRIDNLKLQLNTVEDKNKKALALYNLITSNKDLNTDVIGYVDGHIDETNDKFNILKTNLRNEYIKYLLNGGMCTEICTDDSNFAASGNTCDVNSKGNTPTGTTGTIGKTTPSASTTAAEKEFKQKIIDTMWSGYCSDGTVEGCQQ